MVISLKKYLDMDGEPPRESGPDPAEVLPVLLQCYRAALLTMGKSGSQACPAVGTELQEQLVNLEALFSGTVTASLAKETEAKIEQHLQEWGGRSAEYFKAKANEVKEILIVLARAAESVGERDQRYAGRFTELTAQLQTIANLEDLTQVRSSLVKRAAELKTYVDQMAQESKKSVALLQSEVSVYETKLKAAEALALRDVLTGLANRRNVEERIEWRIAQKQVFCLVVMDLNDFKEVNDTYGHLAGDSLLKQFAQELRGSIRSSDLVGRWSGDEFVVVLDSDLASAKAQIERVQNWVFGEYPIQPAGKPEVKVKVEAAIGMAVWRAGQTLQQVIEYADAAMYEDKKLAKKLKRAAKA
jgi:diguanylate cyclase (GGDEF)-like protein